MLYHEVAAPAREVVLGSEKLDGSMDDRGATHGWWSSSTHAHTTLQYRLPQRSGQSTADRDEGMTRAPQKLQWLPGGGALADLPRRRPDCPEGIAAAVPVAAGRTLTVVLPYSSAAGSGNCAALPAVMM